MSTVPLFQDSGGSGCHAVDAPVGDAVTIANRDGKPAEIGPDDLNRFVFVAGKSQFLAFALIRRALAGSVGSLSWREKNRFKTNIQLRTQ